MKMRFKRLTLTIGVVCVGGAGATAVALSTSGAVADDPPAVRVAQAPSSTLPDAVLKALGREESSVAEFGIDPAGARSVQLPSGDTVWYTPGKNGGCIWPADGAGSCTDDDGVAAGKLALVALPPFKNKIDPGVRVQKIQYGEGPVRVVGVAPEGITEITITDEAGKTRATTSVVDGFYEIVADDWQGDGWTLALSGENKHTVKLPL